ncbi:MAG: hypothetical protein E7658_07335 [Ruminococcaceae bacterium]|nr:hypothetical protein [Oscillospiraceae bacterium]
MLETILAGIFAYAGTNVDDLFINTLYFAQADNRKQTGAVVVGKYLGIGALVIISLLGAFVLHAVPEKYIGILGLVPMALGIKEWIGYIKSRNASEDEEEQPDVGKGLMIGMALVTVANGADNIGVYIPLFAGYSLWQIAVVIAVFAVLTAVWCFLGKKLADLPGLRGFLLRNKKIIVPIVLILLGVYIIMKSVL